RRRVSLRPSESVLLVFSRTGSESGPSESAVSGIRFVVGKWAVPGEGIPSLSRRATSFALHGRLSSRSPATATPTLPPSLEPSWRHKLLTYASAAAGSTRCSSAIRLIALSSARIATKDPNELCQDTDRTFVFGRQNNWFMFRVPTAGG